MRCSAFIGSSSDDKSHRLARERGRSSALPGDRPSLRATCEHRAQGSRAIAAKRADPALHASLSAGTAGCSHTPQHSLPALPLRFKPHLRDSALPSRAMNTRVTPYHRASPAIAGRPATSLPAARCSGPARLPPRPPAMITSPPACRPLRATERRPPPSALIAATGDRLQRAALPGPAARPRPGTARGAEARAEGFAQPERGCSYTSSIRRAGSSAAGGQPQSASRCQQRGRKGWEERVGCAVFFLPL